MTNVFIAETMSLLREAKAATLAGVESQLPTWVSFTVDDEDGTRLRSGELLREAAQAVIALGAQSGRCGHQPYHHQPAFGHRLNGFRRNPL